MGTLPLDDADAEGPRESDEPPSPLAPDSLVDPGLIPPAEAHSQLAHDLRLFDAVVRAVAEEVRQSYAQQQRALADQLGRLADQISFVAQRLGEHEAVTRQLLRSHGRSDGSVDEQAQRKSDAE